MTMSESPTQNVFPYRSDYARGDRHDDYQPHQPTVPAARGLTGTAVERAEGTFEHAIQAHTRYLDQLKQDRHRYSESGYAEQAAMFSETAAAKAVDAAVQTVQARADQAQAAVDKMRASFVKPGDAAQESRNLRYWNRTRAVLDTAKTGGKFTAAEALLNKADRAELSVLLEELPSYLQVHIGPMDDSTKHRLDLPKDADWADWIDAVYVPRAVPEYGQAKAKLAKANKAATITRHSADMIKKSITDGRALPRLFASAHNHDPDK